jgi:hypothetical protein
MTFALVHYSTSIFSKPIHVICWVSFPAIAASSKAGQGGGSMHASNSSFPSALFYHLCSIYPITGQGKIATATKEKSVCVLCVGVISTICMSYMRHQRVSTVSLTILPYHRLVFALSDAALCDRCQK